MWMAVGDLRFRSNVWRHSHYFYFTCAVLRRRRCTRTRTIYVTVVQNRIVCCEHFTGSISDGCPIRKYCYSFLNEFILMFTSKLCCFSSHSGRDGPCHLVSFRATNLRRFSEDKKVGCWVRQCHCVWQQGAIEVRLPSKIIFRLESVKFFYLKLQLMFFLLRVYQSSPRNLNSGDEFDVRENPPYVITFVAEDTAGNTASCRISFHVTCTQATVTVVWL